METTLAELDSIIERINKLRAEEADLAAKKRVVTAELESVEESMIAKLQENGRTNYRGPGGLASISFRTSVKTPKTEEEKKAFAEALKADGLFWVGFGVNSQWLNGYYKSKLEEAQKAGLAEAPTIPGISGVEVSTILSMRK